MKKMLVVAAMATLAMTPAVSSAQGVQGAGAGQNTLSAARELYASARYDEALTVLNSIPAGGAADRRSV